MNRTNAVLLLLGLLSFTATSARAEEPAAFWPFKTPPANEPVWSEAGKVPSPIFDDPNYESAADSECLWNAKAKEWWLFYTARRITADNNPGCGGSPVRRVRECGSHSLALCRLLQTRRRRR